MNKSKYNKRNKPQSLPQYGWGSTIGGIAGGALGTLLGPFGTTIGAGLGRQLGNMIDGEENTQGNIPQMPQLNIDPVNTQDFYNPVKAFGGNINPNAEVEGNEVIQYQPGMQPKAIGQGNMQQIASDMSVAKGPTHANGGVPVVAQPGSMVISDRLPAPNTKEYKSIANKVEQLGRKKGQLEKKIEKNPNDKIAKDTIGLVQKQIDTLIQQQEQMKAMNAESIMAKAYQKAYGGNIGLDPMFLKLWNTGSYAYGGELPKFDGINNPSSYIDPFEAKSNGINWNNYMQNDNTIINLHNKGLYPNMRPENRYTINEDTEQIKNNNISYIKKDIDDGVPYKEQNQYTKPIPQTNQNIITGIMNSDLNTYNQSKSNNNINYALPESYMPNYLNNNMSNINEDARVGYMPSKEVTQLNTNRSLIGKDGKPLEEFKVTGYEGQTNVDSLYPSKRVTNGRKVPLKENTFGNNLQYAAQYIPDVMAMFTKKDKPIDPNMYMNTSRVTPAKYDTSAEEAAVIDARNQAMMLAKETSGGDAGMYANLGNVATTGAYKNLGQVYNKAQNINMQNKMAADQVNAGIEGQNRQMALNVANMNQADAQAVESMRQAGMQGLSNKLANQYSQNRQFKLLESMFPHYKYNDDGSVIYNGKTYYGDEATGIVDNLKMYASKLGINWFGGK